MKIIKRNELRRGGFAGLRETRLVMSPRLFRGQREAGTSAGIGRLAYLADARFLPHGDTRMHTHREIDVISVMVLRSLLVSRPLADRFGASCGGCARLSQSAEIHNQDPG